MKKGFTLIEIIVVIVLLAVIGTGSTIAVIKVQDKKTEDLLVKNEKKLENALDVYLANHNEVINNINNNSEGAIVSLELLKNEGLITEELGNNKEYFIVSKALLSNSIPTEEDCENGLNIETIASWVKDEDPSKVLYFCPKTYKTKECVTTTGCPACSETCEIKIDDPKDACGKELNENSLACVIFKNIDKIDSNTKFKEPDELNIGESTYESGYYQKIKYSTINKIADNYTSEYGDEYVLNQSGYDKNNANFVGYYLCLTKKDNVEKINSDGKFVFKNKTAISGANLNVTKSSSKNKNQDYINALNIIKNKVNIEDYYLFENTTTDIYETGCKGSTPTKLITKINYHENCKKESKLNECQNKLDPKTVFSSTDNYISFDYITAERKTQKTLSKSEDECSYSYYFRGNVEDNFVEFNNICWQVLRIEGDGSVKLIYRNQGNCNSNNIIDYILPTAQYGILNGNPSYNYNTGSRVTLRDVLSNVYNEKLAEQMAYLKNERFCLGLSVIDDVNSRDVSITDNISYKCIPDDDAKTIKSYVSSLTIDEAIYSGISLNSESGSFITDYNFILNKEELKSNNKNIRTISIYDKTWTYNISLDGKIDKSSINNTGTSEDLYVKPVIVLKTGILSNGGNGTIDNPYKISLPE